VVLFRLLTRAISRLTLIYYPKNYEVALSGPVPVPGAARAGRQHAKANLPPKSKAEPEAEFQADAVPNLCTADGEWPGMDLFELLRV